MMIYRRIIPAALIRRKHVPQFTASFTNQTNINDHPNVNNDVAMTNSTPSDPLHDFIETTKTQRIILGIGSSMAALVNPRR